MSCPDCGSVDTDLVHTRDDGQGWNCTEEYECNKCGCEWEWEMSKTIIKHGEVQDEKEC
jgi:transcriptional regulator NrdR family protein